MIENIKCKECIFVGEYSNPNDKNYTYFNELIAYCRENELKIIRKGVTYNVSICVTANRKKIIVTAIQESMLQNVYEIIMEIVRFENLFEGMFYSAISCKVDGSEKIDEMVENQLKYYCSTKRYTFFSINLNNRIYKKMYFKWVQIERRNKLTHQVFLYATYLDGMPVDLRMALLLETFEPIAERLHKKGEIVLIKSPTITYTNICSACKNKVSRTERNKRLLFEDKIRPLIRKYGKEIFVDDNKSRIIKKAVKIRNKVDHVNAKTKNAMNGKQCGFYLYKFSLLYRYIILLEIGMERNELLPGINRWIQAFNENYPDLRIKK